MNPKMNVIKQDLIAENNDGANENVAKKHHNWERDVCVGEMDELDRKQADSKKLTYKKREI